MSEEHHPIDYAEEFAEAKKYEFDRMDDNQIAMSIEGQWQTYSVTLAKPNDDVLRMILMFDMKSPDEYLSAIYEILNLINRNNWLGTFVFWAEDHMMTFCYGLLVGEDGVSAKQVETMITNAVITAERYFPAFQLVLGGGSTPKEALKIAIAEAYGRA